MNKVETKFDAAKNLALIEKEGKRLSNGKDGDGDKQDQDQDGDEEGDGDKQVQDQDGDEDGDGDKDAEEAKDDGEEGDEDEGEEDEDNSYIELYFQPKFQYPHANSFMARNMLEVLYIMLDEKMYDELRTKQQLGYFVGVSKK